MATVALAAIDNIGEAENAGWALDGAGLSWQPDNIPIIVTDIAVSDFDGGILRVSYYAVVVGSGYQAVILQ